MERFAEALARIDAVHGEDPEQEDGRPRELVYAERMTTWLARLTPGADEALRIAVRAQHLARWRSPRSAYPEGRVGYLSWRRAAGARHAADVEAIVRACGYDEAFAARVARLVAKKDPRTPDGHALEDCACLVFLAHELDAFAGQHDDAKVIDVLRKSWAKMSEAARHAASTLPFGERSGRLVAAALA